MKERIFLFFLIITIPALLLECNKDKVEIPKLTTTDPTKISVSSITSGGGIVTDGGSAIISRGACWNPRSLATTEDSKTLDGEGVGNFSSLISGLNENTIYSVRAYATNSVGTGYGNEILCRTLSITLLEKGWIIKNSNTTESLYSVYFPEPGTGYVVGNLGTILKTTDGGESWNKNNSGTSKLLRSVYFTDLNIGFAVGDSGVILKTLNAGSRWTHQNSGIMTRLISVFFIDSNIGWIAGEKGLILKTTDGGTNWIAQNSISLSSLYSVIFTDSNTGFCIDRSNIYKTIDGGITWVPKYKLSILNSFFELSSLFFTNSSNGYVIGGSPEEVNSILLKTTDAGDTWKIERIPKNLGFKVFFNNIDTGYVITYRSILKTTDGGVSWATQISTSYSLNSIFAVNSKTCYAIGDGGAILKTVNGGSN